MAYAVAMFGLKLDAGIARLKTLLGGGATVDLGIGLGGRSYAPPWGRRVCLAEGSFSGYVKESGAMIFTHELAHVIDYANSFSKRWSVYRPLTEYAGQEHVYPNEWEVWAEAVTVWVFGDFTSSGYTSYYMTSQVKSSHEEDPEVLATDMRRMGALLNGWY